MSAIYPYEFEAPIERFGVGIERVIWYNVLMLPDDLRSELPFDQHPRLRVEGEIADVPIANAFMPTGDGRNYVIVAPSVLKEADVALGDLVEMRFKIADQDHVDVPEALSRAIELDTDARVAWGKITPGKKRMLAQHVLSAKTDKTRSKRVNEATDALVNFGADLRAWRKAQQV
ncbi:MAG: YdeI/OmpD-associated family protein [Pseudomonadota bacterium]